MAQGDSRGPAFSDDLDGTGGHLTADELRLWTSFLDAGRIVETEIERQLVDEHDMSHREYEVLVRLDGAGGSMRMRVLARQIEASSPLVTQTVQRLEARGWVERRPIAEDRRGVEASLLADGRAALASASRPHAELIRQLLLDPIAPDVAEVARALGTVADHLRAHRGGEVCPEPSCPLNSPTHST